MKSVHWSYSNILLFVLKILTFCLLTGSLAAQAQTPFTCDSSLYIVTGNNNPISSQLFRINRSTTPFTFDPVGPPTTIVGGYPNDFQVNALAYNPVDNFMYAIVRRPTNNTDVFNQNMIVRIDAAGQMTVVTEIAALPGVFSATFLRDGTYVVGTGNRILTIDLTATPPAILTDNTIVGVSFTDFAVNPTDPDPDRIYFVSEAGANDIVRFADARTGVVEGTLPNPTGTNINAGSQFFDSFGNLYYRSNTDENLYIVDMDPTSPTYGVATLLTQGPSGGQHDGASCAFDIAMEKTVSSDSVSAGATVTYTYRISNPRSLPVTNLTFTDIMDNGRLFVASSLVNPDFGGTANAFADTNALTITGGQVAANTVAEIQIDVTISATTSVSPIFNQATISGLEPSLGSSVVSDFPTSAILDDPTPLNVVSPIIGVAKSTEATIDNGDGTFTTTITITVENLGTTNLVDVRITDDLTTTFPAPATFAVSNITSPVLDVNNGFNGVGDPNLLTGSDTLTLTESASVSFDVTFNPNGLPGPFNNQAFASASDPFGTSANDSSDDGTNPDTNNNGDPGDPDEDDPTPISFVENPIIGVAKSASPSSDNGNGTFTTTITLTIENLGNVVLNNIQLSDNLVATFPAPATFTVSNITSPTLTIDNNFNGNNNVLLLTGADTLAVNATASASFDVTFNPNGLPGPFNNQAIANAQGPSSTGTTDNSDEGTDPDNNNNNDPGDPDEEDPTVISFVENPVIGVAKSATPTQDNNDGTFTTTITLTLENLGNVVLNEVQITDNLTTTFPAPVTFNVSNLTSPTLSTNNSFNGSGVIHLLTGNVLSGTESLAVGASATVSFDVTFNPNGLPGPFNNTAIGTAVGPGSGSTSDNSDEGNDTDMNNNSNPSDPGEDDPTIIPFIENPIIGIAKSSGPTTDNGNGTFTTTITLTVENLGNVLLTNVQISDDLAMAFPAPATVIVSNQASPSLTIDNNFNGTSAINLLSGTDSLAVGELATISFDLTFNPNGLAGPFNNQAIAQAESPAGSGTSDQSDNGTEVDNNGNDDPSDPGEDDPTIIVFTENPIIGIAKSASPTTDNGNGTFTTTITLTVENLGNVILNSVQISDDLTTAFPSSVTVAVSNLTSPLLTTNSGFNGTSDNNLLSGSDVLAIGAVATVSFDLTFNPNGLAGPFNNQAIAQALSPSGSNTSDNSDDGTEVDSNGNTDPSDPGEDNPTIIVFTENPIIGIAKSAGPTTDNGNGTFTTTITLTVENLGNVLLNNVQVTDDLVQSFSPPATVTITNITSPSLTTNNNFNGTSAINLLSGTDSLAVGALATVSFDLTFNPNGLAGPFNNQAIAQAESPAGAGTSDQSDNGTEVDNNGNDDPSDPGEDDPTIIVFTENPIIGIAKSASPTTDNGDGTFTTTITLIVENLGNVILDNLSVNDDLRLTFPVPATFSVANLNSPSLAVNNNFNGSTITELVASTNTLGVAASASLSFDVTFNPNGLTGPFNNQAIASSQGPGGATTTDLSDNGANPDNNGNGNPADTDEGDPSIIDFNENPVIGTAKMASPAIDNGDGSYTTTVTLLLENLGNVILSNVQVSDNLSATFPTPATFTIANITSAGLTANSSFNGTTSTNLLTGTDTLPIGASATVSFELTFRPNGLLGPFVNQAIGSAQGPSSDPSSDLSNDGNDPDPNGDGNPSVPNEDQETPIAFTNNPVIGIAKAASPSRPDGPAFFTTITLTVENLGNVVLTSVQVTDDLVATFPAPAAFAVQSLSSARLSINNNYDGRNDINLLTGADVLQIGEVATISLTLAYNPRELTGPFRNQAIAGAQSPSGEPTTDLSNAGTIPDLNGDGDPSVPNEDNETPIEFEQPFVEIPTLNIGFMLSLILLLMVLGALNSRNRFR